MWPFADFYRQSGFSNLILELGMDLLKVGIDFRNYT